MVFHTAVQERISSNWASCYSIGKYSIAKYETLSNNEIPLWHYFFPESGIIADMSIGSDDGRDQHHISSGL